MMANIFERRIGKGAESILQLLLLLIITVSTLTNARAIRTNTADSLCAIRHEVALHQDSVWRCPCSEGDTCRTVTDPNMPFSPSYSKNSVQLWRGANEEVVRALNVITRVKGTKTRRGMYQKLQRVSINMTATHHHHHLGQRLQRLGLVGIPSAAASDIKRSIKNERKREQTLEELSRLIVQMSEHLQVVVIDELANDGMVQCNDKLLNQYDTLLGDVTKQLLCHLNTLLQMENRTGLTDVVDEEELLEARDVFMEGRDTRTKTYEADYALFVYMDEVFNYTKVLSGKMVKKLQPKKSRRTRRRHGHNGKKRARGRRNNKRNSITE